MIENYYGHAQSADQIEILGEDDFSLSNENKGNRNSAHSCHSAINAKLCPTLRSGRSNFGQLFVLDVDYADFAVIWPTGCEVFFTNVE